MTTIPNDTTQHELLALRLRHQALPFPKCILATRKLIEGFTAVLDAVEGMSIEEAAELIQPDPYEPEQEAETLSADEASRLVHEDELAGFFPSLEPETPSDEEITNRMLKRLGTRAWFDGKGNIMFPVSLLPILAEAETLPEEERELLTKEALIKDLAKRGYARDVLRAAWHQCNMLPNDIAKSRAESGSDGTLFAVAPIQGTPHGIAYQSPLARYVFIETLKQ